MCIRIRIPADQPYSGRYSIRITRRDSEGVPSMVDGILEWWDGSTWQVAPVGDLVELAHGALVKKGDREAHVRARGGGKSVATAVAAGPKSSPGPAYNVYLRSVGPNTVGVIKALRKITGLGLKEAKDITDAISAGSWTEPVLRTDYSWRAEDAEVTLRAAGASTYTNLAP